MPAIKLIFAVDSALYAPVHLAIALSAKGRPGFEHLIADWDIAKPPAWDSSEAPHSGNGQEPTTSDPLVLRVTRFIPLPEDRNFLCLGVGDPMRIATAPEHPAFHEPRAVACLVSKMCYWVIDSHAGQHLRQSDCYLNPISQLLVHPKGMTGYALPLFHLTTHHGRQLPDLKQRFFEVPDPTKDRDAYAERLKTTASSDPPPAYVTPNPFDGKDAYDAAGYVRHDRSLLHDYTKNSDFSSAIMTAFLASAKAIQDRETQIAMKHLFRSITDAIDLLHTTPQLAGAIVYDYARSIATHGDKLSYYRKHSRQDIYALFEFLASLEIYASHRDIERNQWERSQEIHVPMDGLIPKEGAYKERRNVSDLKYDTFVTTVEA